MRKRVRCAAATIACMIGADCSMRRMLRYVFRLHRSVGEPWVEYIERSAHQVDKITKEYGMQDWLTTYRLRKWRFAGALARKEDERWSTLLISTTPMGGSGRKAGRPWTRWSADFENFAGGNWLQVAKRQPEWSALESPFAERP